MDQQDRNMNDALIYVLVSCFAIIGYFLRDLHVQFKIHKKDSDSYRIQASEELGKLKGKIEMVQQQSVNDVTRIEQITQLKLDQISKDVSELTKIIHELLNR
jgi:hypothetical protein